MDTSLFDFDLPKELIAQHPLKDRDKARLMVLHRKTGEIEHKLFKDVISYLEEGDLLVLNDTRVIPARLMLRKETGGKVEVFLLERIEERKWLSIGRKLGKLKEGTVLYKGDKPAVKILGRAGDKFIVELLGELEELGEIPLPPYIKREPEEEDKVFYQTVFAKKNGSVASPTAGLHFTEELLEEIKKKGVLVGFVTLHVGLGTFKPIEVEKVEEHRMHKEFLEVGEELCSMVDQVRRMGKRVFAVGTTVVRALETVGREDGRIEPFKGYTDLYIYPPYRFKVVDALITNFHFPRSTLIVLVSAFAGRDLIMKAYKEAIERRYRFLSYGDAMLIL